MTAETLANDNLNTPANDDVHPLHTADNGGHTVTLRDSVEVALKNYFAQLDGAPVTDVYQLVLSEVEAPLLEQVMKYTRNNQTKASTMLGLNRGTLRKKLKQYGLL
ncbi:DNA-binding transcriptional regulator Fis [Marinobacter lutaoensis]|jgi:Fis family transcriptional regulator|uniref:Putative Fis-like DNA-binding protein n=1 Tax=Marinobacter lutaoensis TaxID=135739 RepID=A0A1V2DRZ1_9GAMM|nr:DNA-binding transcriptional regulator Fis [Marinobacter lutaoensis]MBE02526.1 DNA-binding transcriptional regulator Fis [Marinobacter sp.]MBI43679.1 DNA-binding transcriptional regulator Fis [Oceanospirillales bacterium]NVD36233.1 DNA-binding transcriptional regulator Fis [Marinobacter lutaoensis]ONF43402.1 Fis family transcriptional regulator [Marinobacter lutaoensis]|tara:strand:+ start:2891 stop:3208 length:318 start_codon:yes stop_codon:yes gene_type:complete